MASAGAVTAPLPPKVVGLGLGKRLDALRNFHTGAGVLRDHGGPVVRVPIGPRRVAPQFVLVTSPAGAHDVLAGFDGALDKGVQVHEETKHVGLNLFNLPHESWTPRRRAIQPLFTRKHVRDFAVHMSTEAQLAAERAVEAGRVALDPFTRRLTLQVLGRSVLGQDLGPRAQAMAGDFATLLEYFTDRGIAPVRVPAKWPTPGNRRFARARERFFAVIDEAGELEGGDVVGVARPRTEGQVLPAVAATADQHAWARATRPKACKLAANPVLAGIVAEKLGRRCSPQQIAGWLKLTYPHDPEMHVSHESIYRTLFVQSRGALRKELTAYLRTGRVIRRVHGVRLPDGRGGRPGILHISERPAEAEDRAVPGHWEGDLVFGKGMSPVATLVERSTRFLMLVALPGGHRADAVADALAAAVTTLPAQLVRSLTWDQGTEMAAHQQFTTATGIEVYFCDPKSPWQRGSNENTNGLLRQYLPRRVDFRTLTQADFDAIAQELNERPRQTLGFKTPSQALAEVLRRPPEPAPRWGRLRSPGSAALSARRTWAT